MSFYINLEPQKQIFHGKESKILNRSSTTVIILSKLYVIGPNKLILCINPIGQLHSYLNRNKEVQRSEEIE